MDTVQGFKQVLNDTLLKDSIESLFQYSSSWTALGDQAKKT